MSASLNIGALVEAIASASNKAEVVAIIVVNGDGGSKENKDSHGEMSMDEYPHERPQGDIQFEKDFFLQEFMEAIFGKKKKQSVAGSGGGSSLDNAILQGPFTP